MNQEKTTQQLQNDAKENNIKLIGLNEKVRVKTNDIKDYLQKTIEEKFPRIGEESNTYISEA